MSLGLFNTELIQDIQVTRSYLSRYVEENSWRRQTVLGILAKTGTVGEMRLYLDRKLLVGEQRSKIIGLVNTVKGTIPITDYDNNFICFFVAKYQEYRNIEGCSELPELTF